jgi:hypothetical protein
MFGAPASRNIGGSAVIRLSQIIKPMTAALSCKITRISQQAISHVVVWRLMRGFSDGGLEVGGVEQFPEISGSTILPLGLLDPSPHQPPPQKLVHDSFP